MPPKTGIKDLFDLLFFSFIAVSLSWEAQLLAVSTGYEINDLYSNDLETFRALTEQGWTPYDYTSMSPVTTVASTGEVFECNNQLFFRTAPQTGYGVNFIRAYTLLPPHDVVTYHMTAAVFDDNTGSRSHQIWTAGLEFADSILMSPSYTNMCGGPEKDYITHIYGKFLHSDPTLAFVPYFTGGTLTSGTFFGIRDIKFILRSFQGTETTSGCTFPRGQNAITSGTCTCGLKQYLDGGLASCQPCHASCLDCTGPDKTDCLTCPSGSFYHQSSKTCITCASGCFLCSGPAESECYQCLPNYFMYWNNSCKASCELPLMVGRMVGASKLCITPCQSNGEYQLWDYTCSSSCNSPSVPRTQGDAKFCDLCSSGMFRYPDGKCSSYCPEPYKKRNEGSVLFCDYPCDEDQKFYYLKDSRCRSTCEYPLEVHDDIFCSLSVSTEETAQLTAVAGALSLASNVGSSVGTSVGLINFANPLSVFIEAFSDMLKYFKYMDIKYPTALEYTLRLKIDPPFSLIPELPDNAIDKIPKYHIAEWFEEDDLHSSFLVNFWGSLVILTLISVVIFLSVLFAYCPKSWTKIHRLNNKIVEVFRWNFTLTLFTSCFGDIVLYTYLEFTTTNPNTFLPILSFIICFLVNLLVFIVFIKMIRIILIRWSFKKVKDDAREKYLTQYSSIFESVEDKSIAQQVFMCLFVARLYLFVGVIIYLPQFPFIQAILITLLNLSMLIYLAIIRPLKDRLDLIMNIIQEFIMLCAKGSVLGLASLDRFQVDNPEAREILGQVVLKAQIALSGAGTLYLIIRTILTLKDVYIAIKEYRTKPKTIQSNQPNVENMQVGEEIVRRGERTRGDVRFRQRAVRGSRSGNSRLIVRSHRGIDS